MKKYVVSIQLNNVCSCMEDGLLQGDAYESPVGNWVKAEEAEEILADFHSILTYVQAHYPQNLTLINIIQNAIKKAEEV